MKRIVCGMLLLGIAMSPIWADGQFRIAGYTSTPAQTLPSADPDEWHTLVIPTERTMTGWYWEVIFNHLGLGMHYGMRFDETIVAADERTDWFMDWQGDFFLSYHVLGGGSVIDPFVEFGWGNVGTALVSTTEYPDYPDWEDEVAKGSAVALGFYNYFGAGVAVDLNGLMIGGKVSYIPSELIAPVVDPSIDRYDLAPFEVSIFGGIALGGHQRWRNRDHDWDHWD